MTEPSRKRTRSADDAAPEGPPPAQLPSGATRRDDEFWFDDGNLIIVAQDVEFRIYKGPLIKHSPVFRDMLTLPQPTDTSDQCCPVVPIPEYPIAFKHLLREFMAGNAFRFPDEKPVFEVACAIVRLGHKYEFDAIASKGLAYLTDIYPSSWLRWAHRLNLSSLDGSEPVLPSLARSISVMNIARITDTPPLLLPALVECCNMEFHELVAGYKREDGVIEHLSADDLARVVRTRTEMVRLDALAALRIFRGVSAGCKNPTFCNRTFQDALWSLTEPGSTMTFRPLERDRHWADYAVGCSSRYKFCEGCKQRIRSQASSERMKIWDLLPSIFGIPELPGHCWM